MSSFMKNKQTGSFDVIGLENELGIGDVAVTKKDGTKRTVYIYMSRSHSLAGMEKIKGSIA